MNASNLPIVERLIASIEGLQDAIASAKTRITDSPTGKHYLPRLDQLDSIATQQIALVPQLVGSIAKGDADEVARLVARINGMSLLIKEDSRDILAELSGQKTPLKTEEIN